MLTKYGDEQPITHIIQVSDLDDETKKQLEKMVKEENKKNDEHLKDNKGDNV